MIDKIKKLHKVYKQERYIENVKNLQNQKTGISPLERDRLLNYTPFKEGFATFFDRSFLFSHGPSFVHSIDELFKDEIYKFTTTTDTPYIIDCGANIGLSIYYFKKLFPHAKILAFEPDDQIFNLLKKNTEHLSGVILEKKAVWTEDTNLSFFSEGALAGSMVANYGNNDKIIKIDTIDLKKYLDINIDFLKIDIEGAENELIFDLQGHLNNVKHLFLEYHGILEQPQNLGEILNLLKKEGFQYYIRLAAETINFPYCNEKPENFNQQLNIFCYR